MKRRAVALILALCLSLSGCSSLLSGQMYWEQTHAIPSFPDSNQEMTASNYSQLVQALSTSIEKGMDHFTVSVANYDSTVLEGEVEQAVLFVRDTNPVAAYAVSDIGYRIGVSGGESVLLVKVTYIHDQSYISRILRVNGNEAARAEIVQALNRCDAYLVLRVDSYAKEDLLVYIEQYAVMFPQYVIEMPQVTINMYPETGEDRVLEIRFHYTTGRDTLQSMQENVLTVFASSSNMVSLAENTKKKFTQLYSLVVDRFQKYTIETSMTPAYSLLIHGVGDVKAFAVIYAAMCRDAGLDCQVVAGTKAGKLWYWNIVCVEGTYYHVDLLRCKSEGTFHMMTDTIIEEGYVWDFSAYPACGVKEK